MIYDVIRNFSLKSAPLTGFLSALNTIMILVFHLISFVTRFFGTGAFVWKNTWYLQDFEIPTVIFTQWLTPINNYDFVKSKFYWNCTLLLPTLYRHHPLIFLCLDGDAGWKIRVGISLILWNGGVWLCPLLILLLLSKGNYKRHAGI